MIIDLTTINYHKNNTPRTCLEIKTNSDYISYGNTIEIIQLKNEIKSNGFFVTHFRYAVLTNFRILIYADKETFLKKKKPKNDFNIFEYDFEVEGKAFKIIKNNITVKIYYFSSISIAILWWESIKQIRVGGRIELDENGNQIISYNNINNNLTKKITIIENDNINNITEINNHILSRNKNKNTRLRKNYSDNNIGNTIRTEKNSFSNNNQNNIINTHNIINEKITTTHNIINEYNISTKKSKNYDLNTSCILNEKEGNYKLNNIRKSILNNDEDITKPLYCHKTYRGNRTNYKSVSPSYIYKAKTKRVHIEEGNNKNYYFDKNNGNINEIYIINKGKEIKSPEFKQVDETILKENASFISNNSGFLYITHNTPSYNNERNNIDNLKTKMNQYENENSNSIYKEESINKKRIINMRNKNNNFYENENNNSNIKIGTLDINCNNSNEDSGFPIIIKTKPTYLKNILIKNENNNLKNINNSNKLKNDNNYNNNSNIKNNTCNNYKKIPSQIQSSLMKIVNSNKIIKKNYIDNIKSHLNPNMVTAIIDNNNSIIEEKNNLISEKNSKDNNLNSYQILEQDNNNDSNVFNNKIYNENNSNISEYCNNGDNSEINNYNENSNLSDNIIKVNKTSINNNNEESEEENTIYNNYDSSEVSNDEEKSKKKTNTQNMILNSSLKNIINPDNESEISNTIPQNINIISLSNSDYGISTLKDNNINGSRINLYNENTNEKSNNENSNSMLYIDNLNSYVNNTNNNVNNSNVSQLNNSKIMSSDNINFDLSENNNSISPINNIKKVVSSDKTLNISSNNNNNNILSDNIFSISSESQIVTSKNNHMKIGNENPISKPSNFENNFIVSNIYPQNHNESKFINYEEIYNNSILTSNNNQSKISNYDDNKFNNSNYNEQSNNSNLYNFTKSNNSNLNNINKDNERIYDNNSTIETNFVDINRQINHKKELNFSQQKVKNNNENKQINLNTNNPSSKINLSLISNSSRLNNYSDIYNKKSRNKKEAKVIVIENENEIPLLNDNLKKNKLEYKNKLNTDYINMNYSKINIIDKIQNNGNENNSSIQKSKKIENNLTTNNTETYNLETKNSIYNNKNKNVLNLNNSKINFHQRSKSNLPNHQKSLIFFENEYIFKEEKYNYINQKKQPSQLIEELLENRYSLEMLIFSVKEKTKNSTFFTKLDYNLKTILNFRSFNLVILNSLFQKFPLIYKNRLMKEDIKDYIFDFVNNNSIIHKKIRNLILNDIIAIKELINSYYEEIHYSMKSNIFIEHFNNFNIEMDNISELIKI